MRARATEYTDYTEPRITRVKRATDYTEPRITRITPINCESQDTI
jgi:hypothetical protein